ncbi:LacI family DNA-binding transcriptional regulator [Escherichia coli]
MATAKKITIHDVALAAGVSVSTLSLVLSGKGRISTATGERVNAAIEELGFVRNRQASALRGRQSGVIGLIVRDYLRRFAELTAGLTEALEAQGRMVFCFTAVKTASSWHSVLTVTESGCGWCGNRRGCRKQR